MNKYFRLAKSITIIGNDNKHYLFGAIGIRKDGCLVSATNIRSMHEEINCHAETRLTKKLDVGSIVYVVRISKNYRNYLGAKPCKGCQIKMRNKGVKKVYYSINNSEYGVIEF